MWTRENRGLYERKGVRYPSDLSDAEWALIAPLIPPAKRGGRHRDVDVREVMNGVLSGRDRLTGSAASSNQKCERFWTLPCARVTSKLSPHRACKRNEKPSHSESRRGNTTAVQRATPRDQNRGSSRCSAAVIKLPQTAVEFLCTSRLICDHLVIYPTIGLLKAFF